MATTISLLGPLQANAGERFIFLGPNEGPGAACEPCKLKGACFNLEPGEVYDVKAVRDKTHPCYLHEGGIVHVVEVERAAQSVIVPARGLTDGQSLVYPERECEFRGCPFWRKCVGAPLRPGYAYKVVQVGETVACPLGYALRRATLQPKG